MCALPGSTALTHGLCNASCTFLCFVVCAGFIALNARLNVWRKRVLGAWGTRGRLIEGALISAITSALSFMLPLLVACQVGSISLDIQESCCCLVHLS